MKRIIYSVLIFIGVIAIFFFAAAFTNWEINPKYWSESARAVVGVMGTTLGVSSVGLFNGIIYNSKS